MASTKVFVSSTYYDLKQASKRRYRKFFKKHAL